MAFHWGVNLPGHGPISRIPWPWETLTSCLRTRLGGAR